MSVIEIVNILLTDKREDSSYGVGLFFGRDSNMIYRSMNHVYGKGN
jgi:hypothetical protein